MHKNIMAENFQKLTSEHENESEEQWIYDRIIK